MSAPSSNPRETLTIVDAAVLFNGTIWRGRRHSEIMWRIAQVHPKVYVTQEMQGFVTSDGRFVNRFQAGAVAFRAGQTKTRIQTLLSEHLWPS